MRRRRTKLQVTTFPFLAVLLCAMGALLLLLFIMDRRAKIAAQHQVNEAQAKRKERTKAEEDERLAAWEKAKAALHQSLVDQQKQTSAEATGVLGNVSDASTKLNVLQARHVNLLDKTQEEKNRIAQLQVQIMSQQAETQKLAKKENASKAELLAAAKELAELEAAFRQMRALRERDQQTYSVVPYRGKRGDTRAPIYVECVRDGVVFHPEKKLLAAWRMTQTALREEIERHGGPLPVQQSPPKKDQPGAAPTNRRYVLFLIRPDGIEHYYQAQSALKGLPLDFGYELVDEGWVLDFSGDRTQVATSKPAGFGAAPGGGSSETPSPSRIGGGGGGTLKEGGPFAAGPPPVIGGGPWKKSEPIARGPSLLPPGGSPFDPNGANRAGAPNGANNAGGTGGGPTLGLERPVGPRLVAPPGSTTGVPRTGTIEPRPNQGPSFTPIAKSTTPIPMPIAVAGKSGSSGATTPTPKVDPNQPKNKDGQPTGGAVSDTPSQGQPTGGGGSDGSPFRGPPGQRPASPATRLLGNRDFVITVKCQGDAVSVTPGSMAFRWSTANQRATDQALVQSVSSLIARRQASVRPGDPPYRPVIRFVVSREGLRTYYHAYPLLEPLRVPMTRENIEE